MNNSYWEYAGTRYKSKLKAIEASGGDINSIAFSAFNDSFYNFNWAIEPKESYEDLLLARALQLRDTYKYIKLFFSGGHDSTLMLNTFLNNNIHIDEIIVYRYAINDNFTNFSNYEVDHFALPFLKTLQFNIPKTKITTWDFGKDYFDVHLADKWLYTKSNFDMRHWTVPNIKGKNFCYLVGNLDPQVHYKDGRWYSSIFDTNGLAEVASYRNHEFFYTSVDFPTLHAKQLHLVKNYLKYHNMFSVPVNSMDYKYIMRKATRLNSITPDYALGVKAKKVTMLDNPLNKAVLIKSDHKQRDILFNLMSTKIKGKSLVNLIIGYLASTLDLGE
jgi:hypothetical protein